MTQQAPGLPVLFLAGLFVLPAPALAATDTQGVEFFEKKIRPVLVEHCHRCHSAAIKKTRGGLAVDSRAALLQGGESGPALVPGKPERSLLLKALKHDGLKMPSEGKKLSASIIADFEVWIRRGAPAPAQAASSGKKDINWTEARRFWAFQPPVRRAPPAVKTSAWPANEIDTFILAELEKRSLRPVRAASKRELLRRATFDLIGLPPTPEEVADFERNNAPNAFARAIDRLLASSHYGERWGRYWLDVARYADDKALAFPTPWPHSYRYRDWVVGALNRDLPYDRFLRLQLAADLDPTVSNPLDRAALGFQGLGAVYHKGSVPAQVIADELDDRVDTLTRGLMGLTVACARCHDHKFDPIPTKDYYALAAAYNGASWNELAISPPREVARFRAWQKDGREINARLLKWNNEQRDAIVKRELLTVGRYLLAAWRLRVRNRQGIATRLEDVAKKEKLNATFLARCSRLFGPAKKGKTPALLAEWLQVAREAAARRPKTGEIPGALQRTTDRLQEAVSAALTAGKAQLAKQPQQDALLRAFTQGNAAVFFLPPNQLPALLDPAARKQLAALQGELQQHRRSAPPAPRMAHGVSGGGQAMRIALRGNVNRKGELAPPGFLRILQRKAATSRTRFTRLDLAEAVCSPDNPLTARVIVNRVWQHHFGRGLVATASNFGQLGDRPTHPVLLDNLAVRFVQSGWSLKWLHREIMLSATYRLSSIHDARAASSDPDNVWLWRYTPRRLDVEAWRDAILAVSGRLDATPGGPPGNLADSRNTRRTLYGKVSRLEPDKTLVTFDFPDANVSSERRAVTVVPQQQLFALNSKFMIDSARALATRLQQAPTRDRISLAHRLAFGRAPTPAEVELAEKFLDSTSINSKDKLTSWEQYAQAILASNEFVWID